ncbi:hypothetical protein KAS08_02930 [Candidatus Pacearchaeota archaeon]|nr:hypothetical protein [Candidatus Pacearchaeota archaeon]
MKTDLVELISQTPMETKMSKESAKFHERNIQRLIKQREIYTSNFMVEYFNKQIKEDIKILSKNGYSHIAMKYTND